MKRTELSRRTPLLRRSQLRSRPKTINRTDPARIAWKTPHAGFCQCGCNRFSLHLHRHHILYEQHLRAEGRQDVMYEMANALDMHEHCHAAHHSGQRRVPVQALPQTAVAFIMEVLGDDPGLLYVLRYYGREVPEGEGRWRP